MPEKTRPERPKASPTLVDEGGETAYWLATDYSPECIADEWDYLFEFRGPHLGEVWLLPRWTTAAESGDPDRLYELFGDYELSGCSTEVVYDMVKPGTPGAYRYWTTEYPPTTAPESKEGTS